MNKCILIDELTLGFEIIIYLWVEALYSAVAWILKGLSLVERVFEVTWCASTTSRQLTLFLVGLRGICTGSRHMEGTFVPEGCALTASCTKKSKYVTRRTKKDGKDIRTRSLMAPKISVGKKIRRTARGRRYRRTPMAWESPRAMKGGEEFTIRSPKARGNHDELWKL